MFSRPDDIPDAPGSYQFKDVHGRIIYVGKAKSLRSRVSSYFVSPALLHPRTAQMMERAASVEWIQVASEVEAIMLEYNLIKAHRPYFNVRLVDDKSYPWLAVTVDEQYPRAMVTRGTKKKGTRYFGPYAHAYAIRETLDLVLRTFPLRTCTEAKYRRHERLGRPCLLYHIERCSGPCIDAVDPDRYATYVSGLMSFMEGDTKPITDRLERQMLDASGREEYEEAARLRDRLEAVQSAIERQEMVATVEDDLDVIALAESELEAAVQVLYVRRGRVVGRNGFILEKVEPMSEDELVGRVLEVNYGETPLAIAPEILCPTEPADADVYAQWLADRRSGRVQIRVPKRGRKRRLLETAAQNAAEQLVRHRTRRAADLTSRAQALDELQRYLGLREAPLRIECYDMSHLQGTNYVGSMVVMEDGLAKRSDYRRFKVRTVDGNDDFGAMREVLLRRLRRIDEPNGRTGEPCDRADEGLLPPKDGDASGSLGGDGVPACTSRVPTSEEDVTSPTTSRDRPSRFAYPPQLLLLDGGKGQLSVGIEVRAALGLEDRIELAALAKQFEEVYVPGRSDPIRIPRDSDAIYLLQHIRDEAHRFAISYHRELRGKAMTKRALDGIPGLGPKRRRRLEHELGGVRKVRAASRTELRALDWLPEAVADAVYDHLHPRPTLVPAGESAAS